MIPGFGVACVTCVFYSPNPRQPGGGQCRARAPILAQSEGKLRTVWPFVSGHWWCGDHSTIEVEKREGAIDEEEQDDG